MLPVGYVEVDGDFSITGIQEQDVAAVAAAAAAAAVVGGSGGGYNL